MIDCIKKNREVTERLGLVSILWTNEPNYLSQYFDNVRGIKEVTTE